MIKTQEPLNVCVLSEAANFFYIINLSALIFYTFFDRFSHVKICTNDIKRLSMIMYIYWGVLLKIEKKIYRNEQAGL